MPLTETTPQDVLQILRTLDAIQLKFEVVRDAMLRDALLHGTGITRTTIGEDGTATIEHVPFEEVRDHGD